MAARPRSVIQPELVLILAHRGAKTIHRPENTVAAVAAAGNGAAADGVEVDVRLSADGVLLCSHDASLLRLGGTPLVIADSTAAAIRRVPLAGGHRTATLAEVLATARGRLVVEAKPVPDIAAAWLTARALCATLQAVATGPAITVSSFDARLLRLIRAALHDTDLADVHTGLLGEPGQAAGPLLRRTLDDGHDEVHTHVRSLLADPGLVGAAHALGAAVTCWTVNRRADLRRLAQLGVDAVISDRPTAARVALSASLVGWPG